MPFGNAASSARAERSIGPEASPGGWWKAVFLILIAYAASQSIYDIFTITGEYPDDHLIYFQNYALDGGVVFGRDTVNTYGPLGFLLHPLLHGHNFAWAVAFRLAVWALTLGLARLVLLTDAGRRKAPLALFTLVVFLVFDYGFLLTPRVQNYERIIYNNNLTLLLVLLPMAALTTTGRVQGACLAFLGLCAAALPLLKLQYAVTAALLLAFCLVALTVLQGRRALTGLAWAGLGAALALPAYAALFPDPRSVLLFVRGSLEIASGYSEAVALSGPAYQLRLAALPIAAYLLAGLAARRDARFLAMWLAGGLLGFLFFKHGFVRQDCHVTTFFVSFALLCSVLLVLARSRASSLLLGAATLACLGMVLVSARVIRIEKEGNLSWRRDNLVAKAAFARTWGILDLPRLARSLHSPSTVEGRIPPQLAAALGCEKTSLWTLRLGALQGAEVNFVPLYVYQEYNDYTPYLDAMTASRLDDPATAPRYVLFRFEGIDERNPFIDSPRAMARLTERYDALQAGDTDLLERNGRETLPWSFVTVGEHWLGAEEPLDLPPDAGDVYLGVDLEYTPAGQAWVMLYKMHPIQLVATDATGQEHWISISPKVASGPFLINRLPRTEEDFHAYAAGRDFPRVVRVRLSGQGLEHFRKPMRVTLYARQRPEGRLAQAAPGQ